MGNRSGRDAREDRATPGGDTANTQAEAKKSNGKKQRGPVVLKSPQSLERLRDRVQSAARELERLRKENAALTERIRTLESRPAVDLEGTIMAFDEDPDVLREKIEGFISAIDKYLTSEG